jgi:antitoxin MazE
MIAVVDKWGNSLGFRIPSIIAKKLDVRPGSSMKLDLVDEKLIITKNEALTLENLVLQITPQNIHNEHLKDRLKGNEVW